MSGNYGDNYGTNFDMSPFWSDMLDASHKPFNGGYGVSFNQGSSGQALAGPIFANANAALYLRHGQASGTEYEGVINPDRPAVIARFRDCYQDTGSVIGCYNEIARN